ncbi:MAG: acetyl/propionyl/methylcrotonyl-CoA carboxylase subunit alpha [Cumulibacter sp.]
MSRISCILVANRGEIVSRVARTAAQLGIRTAGVYAASDADARYLDDVDLAIALGDDQSASPYLAIEKILDAARKAGADAVHPGYGFLAENADFARAVIDAGLTWIGPSPEAIEKMGGKIGAKEIAAAAGVPVLDSVTVTEDVAASVTAIKGLQPPLLVKPSAGGGGKGMVRLDSHDGLESALVEAARGAASAFGDGTLFVERYLEGPRHVEVQVFGDSSGRVVHLGTRDCSVQRRHQKIIEEAPAPATNPATMRDDMCAAAVALAKEIGYVGAGTVEFLAFDDGFAFLEMNTRLQVEHAVTEEVTGIDLVELQILVASGQPLPTWIDTDAGGLSEGASVEARIYAEDPTNDYLPSPGEITHWSVPEIDGVRWEIGVEARSVVSTRYDPMIAKAVAYAEDRPTALALLRQALMGVEVAGVKTNIGQLVAILGDDEFVSGPVGTDYLDRRDSLVDSPASAEDVRLAAVAAAITELLSGTPGPNSFAPVGFRNLRSLPISSKYLVDGEEIVVDLIPQRDGTWTLVQDSTQTSVRVARRRDHAIFLEIDGVRRRFAVIAGKQTVVHSPGGVVVLSPVAVIGGEDDAEGAAGSVLAPLPGLVVSINVQVGDAVEADQPLIALEAMKMEHKLTAGGSGMVQEIYVNVGDTVDYHDPLVLVEES